MSLVHGFKLFCLAIGVLFNPLGDRWYVFPHAYKAGCDNRRDQDEVERLWMPEQLVQKVFHLLQVKQVKQMKQVKQKYAELERGEKEAFKFPRLFQQLHNFCHTACCILLPVRVNLVVPLN